MSETARIEAEILRLTAERGPGKSVCPSEVARGLRPDSLRPDWQALLPAIRRAAAGLARAGRIEILRKGRPVPPEEMPEKIKGVIRLRIRPENGA